MNVLLIGSGGREHAIAWKLAQSKKLTKLYTAPGNPGTALCGQNVDIDVNDIALFQRLIPRYPMADHIINGGADRLRKAPIIKRCGDSLLSIDDIFVADAVQFIGGDTGLNVVPDHIEYVCS